MNLQQLKYAIAVDLHKHFAHAAEACHITQATLSAMIKKLEQELDVTLFDRAKHPIITTDQGKEILALARQMLQLEDQMRTLPHSAHYTPSGPVTIGIIPTIAPALLPRLVTEVLQQYPLLQTNIVEVTTAEITRRLLNGSLDMGILATPLNNPEIEENVLFYEAMVVYGVTQPHRRFVIAEAFDQQKVWLLQDGHCFREQSVTVCNVKEKPGNDHFTFEGSSFDALINLTDALGGYTLLPELYCQTLPEGRKNKIRPFNQPIPVREISLVYHRPFAKKRIIDTLTQQLTKTFAPNLSTAQLKPSQMSVIGFQV